MRVINQLIKYASSDETDMILVDNLLATIEMAQVK